MRYLIKDAPLIERKFPGAHFFHLDAFQVIQHPPHFRHFCTPSLQWRHNGCNLTTMVSWSRESNRRLQSIYEKTILALAMKLEQKLIVDQSKWWKNLLSLIKCKILWAQSNYVRQKVRLFRMFLCSKAGFSWQSWVPMNLLTPFDLSTCIGTWLY